jgi:hypothetical protein
VEQRNLVCFWTILTAVKAMSNSAWRPDSPVGHTASRRLLTYTAFECCVTPPFCQQVFCFINLDKQIQGHLRPGEPSCSIDFLQWTFRRKGYSSRRSIMLFICLRKWNHLEEITLHWPSWPLLIPPTTT